MPHRIHLVAIAALTCSAADFSQAATPAETQFAKLFGVEIQRVEATAGTEDDLKLGRTLLQTARASNDDPALIAVLLKNAAALAAEDPEGQETALEAWTLLAERSEADRLEARTQIAEIQQKLYTRARGDERTAAGEALIDALIALSEAQTASPDEAEQADTTLRRALAVASAVRSPRRTLIAQRIEKARAAERTTRQIAQLKEQLKNPGGDRAEAARELVMLCVVELDDPGEARKYTFLLEDQELKDNVRLANQPTDNLVDQEAFVLGEWYLALGADAKADHTRAAMYGRAKTYYDRYLALHDKADVFQTKAKLALTRVQKELDTLRPPDTAATVADAEPADAEEAPGQKSATVGKWFDVLETAKPAQYAMGGNWARKGKMITGSATGGRFPMGLMAFPVELAGNYDLQMKFARLSGSSVALAFPVGDTMTSFQMDVAPYAALQNLIDRGGAPGRRGRGAPRGDSGRYNAYKFSGLSRVDGKGVEDEDNPTRVRNALLTDKRATSLTLQVREKDGKASIAISVGSKRVVSWAGPTSQLTSGLPGGGRRRGPANPDAGNGAFLGLAVYNAEAIFQSLKVKMVDGELIRLDAVE